jgi:hypothetical protein
MSYKTILVYLNDGRRAEAVLEPAVRLAGRNDAHLVGMHVYASVPAPPVPLHRGAGRWFCRYNGRLHQPHPARGQLGRRCRAPPLGQPRHNPA